MPTNDIDNISGASTEASAEQTFEPTAEDVSRILRLLDLPELRLDSFNDEESSRILNAIQSYSGDDNDDFTHFLALPALICQAHKAAEAAEIDLLEKFRELEDLEITVNNFPKELYYDNDDDEDEDDEDEGTSEDSSAGVRRGCLTQNISGLDSLTLAVREAHIRTAEAREERECLILKYLGTWLRILDQSSVGDLVHEDFRELQDAHRARVADLEVARWLRDTCPYYEEDWDNGLVWDFIRDGRTALDLLISHGAIIISGSV